MTKFHSDDYIKFLRSIRPDNLSEYHKQMQRCNYLYILWCLIYYVFLINSAYEARHNKTALMSDNLEIELESPGYSRRSYLSFIIKMVK